MMPAAEVRTTCPYCGVGCGVLANVAADGSVFVRGDPDHPANFGKLCSKGSALAETLGLEGRMLKPRIGGRDAGWDEALDLVAEKFSATIAAHGPDSVAFYVSGQLLTEDYYVANKLMKGFVGSANIDTNSRLCMASSVAGHRRAFGEDIVPGTYEDLDAAELFVLVGSNAAWCHPILYQRMVAARARNGARVVVIDPRRSATADECDLHLAIEPGSDVLLFNGLLAHLARTGLVDETYVQASTSGISDAIAAAFDDVPSLEAIAAGCGVSTVDVVRFYELFAGTERVVTLYSQGVNQSSRGTDKVNAILNCHLATGRIGRHGAVLADRPAQCHGRARGRRTGEPARRPYGLRRPRRHRPRRPLLERAPDGPPRRPQGGGHVPRRGRRPHQGDMDHGHQPGRVHARRRPCPRGAARLRLRRRLRHR